MDIMMQTLLGSGGGGGNGNGNGVIPTCESINWFGKTYLSNDADNDAIQIGLCHDRDELLYKEVEFERQESLPCDPDLCRSMGRQICVDCTKCTRHCICDTLQQQQKKHMKKDKLYRNNGDGGSSSTASSSLSCDDEFSIADGNSGDYSVDHRGFVKKKNRSSRSSRRRSHDGGATNNVANNRNSSFKNDESIETRIVSSSQYGCDPTICKDERICGDCSRCSRHCDCALWEEEINSLVANSSITRPTANTIGHDGYRRMRTSSSTMNHNQRSLTRSLSPTGGRYSSAANDSVRRQHGIRSSGKVHPRTKGKRAFRVGKRNWR